MYEYIKGKKIQCPEHMLSATEIASLYGIYRVPGKNGEKLKPNPLIVGTVLKEYDIEKNLNISEFYYSHSRGCMRVYPEMLWRPAMEEFIYKNELYKHSEEKLTLKVDRELKTYNYYYKEPSLIIDITTRQKRSNQNGS
jgi:hypothetical protein